MHRIIGLYRLAHWLHIRGHRASAYACAGILRIVAGVTLPPSARLGPGVRLAYGASGAVVHRDAVIGAGSIIYPGVIVGGRGDHGEGSEKPSVPVIGDRVRLFAGAKVFGRIYVGNDATIGANAVVISDVPASATVVAPLGRVLDAVVCRPPGARLDPDGDSVSDERQDLPESRGGL